eukprot:TRINITY_DN1775_c0_g1_i3.p1 TRINITY_DN1775_c0_g1~~TRINITY_DN1775_c0_g1_i3.p1  ORF type:complete len:1747 (+),score=316.82 TRINITY_DN1775_c0_g1_i3:669-5243(+)
MEQNVEGECETAYTIVKLPQRFNRVHYDWQNQDQSQEQDQEQQQGNLNVTKSINIRNCQRRPIVKYNYRNTQDCKSNDPLYQENDRFVKASTVMKYNLAGNRDRFLIENVQSESQYTVQFYSEKNSYVNVYVNQTLQLFKTNPIQNQIQLQQPQQSETGLQYNQEWDRLNEQFMTEAQGNAEHIYKKPENFIEQIADLIKALAQQTVQNSHQPVPIQATAIFSQLISALRKANPQELEQIHQRFMKNPQSAGLSNHEQKFIEHILESAVGTAGTKAAIDHLVKKIENQELTPSVAQAALRQLPNARVVNKKMVEKIQQLCQNSNVHSHQQLKRACYLTLGSLMKAACSNQKEQIALDAETNINSRCTREDKNRFVQELIQKARQAQKWEDKVLYLKSLGNAALDTSVFELEKFIQNKQQYQPAYARYEAILALRQLVNQMPHKIHKILMPVFMNPREPATVRQVAAYFLLKARPELSVLEQVAKQVDREPIRQVKTFVYQLLSEIANSTSPCEQETATNARQALQLVRYAPAGLLDSKFAQNSFYSTLAKLGADLQWFDIMANNSYLPNLLGMTLNTENFGSLIQDRLMFGLRTEALERLIPNIFNQDGSFNMPESLRRHPRNVNKYSQFLQNLLQKLNIQARQYHEQPKAYTYWRMNGLEAGYLPITEELLNYLTEQNYFDADSMQQMLKSGKTHKFDWHHATMLADSHLKLPLSIGFPMIVKQKTPVVMSVKGTVEPLNKPTQTEIVANIQPRIALKTEETIEVWNPMTPVGLRARAQAKAQLPIAGKVQIKPQQREARLLMQAPQEQKTLLDVETEAITFTRQPMVQLRPKKFAEERVIMAEESNRQQIKREEPTVMGFPFKIYRRYSWPSNQATQNQNWAPMIPFTGPNKVVIQAMPPQDGTQELEMKATVAGSRFENEPIRAKFLQSAYDEASSTESESSEEIEKDFSRDHTRLGQLILEILNRGSSDKRHYQMDMKASGSLKGRFAALKTHLKRQSPEPYQICLDSEVLYPAAPFDSQSVQGKKVVQHTEIRWGQNCQENNFIRLSSSAERTQSQLDYEQQNMEEYHECQTQFDKSPLACHDYLNRASDMNKYQLNIKYNNVPTSVQNITTKLMRALETYYYWNTDINDVHVRNAANQIRAEIRFDARNSRRANITVETPQQLVRMNDVSVWRMPRVNVKKNYWRSVLDHATAEYPQDQQYEPVCKIQNKFIKTFDGQRFRAPLSDCYTVVAQDCSENPQFAVLVKNDQQDPEKKIVKIVTQLQEIKLREQNSEIKVQGDNNEEYSASEQRSAEMNNFEQNRKCYKTGSYVKCNFPEAGLKVKFDGYTALVQTSPYYMGRQCGVCGHMDNNPENDFQSPQFQPQQDRRQFQRDYMLQDEECESEQPELNDFCEDEECRYEPEYTRNSQEQDSYEIPNQYQHQSQVQQPRLMTKRRQHHDKLCVSKTPVKVCPENTQPTQANKQEVEYACVHEYEPEAEEWQRQLRQNNILESEAQSKPTEFTREEIIPTACKKYNNYW